MNIEEIEKELNELKKRSLLCFETLGFQQLRQENMESVLKGNVAKGFDLILKRDIAISRNDNKFFGDGIFQQDLAKLKNDIYRKLFSEGEKDVFESSKMIMHCFCCGTDITDETNCFCLKCFNDKIAHDIKKDMVISREVFNWMTSIIYLFFDKQTLDVRKAGMKKLKEVEEEVEKK